jgi:hypothetical protein
MKYHPVGNRAPLSHAHAQLEIFFQLEFWPAERITELPKSRNGAVPKPKSVVWAAISTQETHHPISQPPTAIPETDGGMEILSQEQEQNQVQEPIAEQIRGDGAESGQPLLVANVEAFT